MIYVLTIFWDNELKKTKTFKSVEGALKFSAEFMYNACIDDDLFDMELVDKKFPEDKKGFVNKCLELFNHPWDLNGVIYDDLDFDLEELEVED